MDDIEGMIPTAAIRWKRIYNTDRVPDGVPRIMVQSWSTEHYILQQFWVDLQDPTRNRWVSLEALEGDA